MAVRKNKKIKFQKDLMIDTVIASVVVQQSPRLVNEYFFKDKPLTGMTLELAAGAIAYGLGLLMKNSNVANIGVALAGSDIINEYVGTSLLSELLPEPTENLLSIDESGFISDSLSGYTNSPQVMDYEKYNESY